MIFNKSEFFFSQVKLHILNFIIKGNHLVFSGTQIIQVKIIGRIEA